MLLSRCTRFGIRSVHFPTAHLDKGRVSWKVALDPNTPKERSVKAFKSSLHNTIERNAWPSESSPEREVLIELINNLSLPHDTLKKQIRKLYQMIFQHRVNDEDIYKAITRFNSRTIVNVITPKPINLKKELQNLKVTAEKYEKERVLKEQNLNEQSLSINNGISTKMQHEVVNRHQKPPVNNAKKETTTETITDRDINALKEFLEKAEKQENEIKKFVLEQQRKYQWSHNKGAPTQLTPGSLLFQKRIPSARIRKVSPFIPRLVEYERLIHPFSSTELTKFLSYDVQKSVSKVEPYDSTFLVHIQKKDLFGVINCGRIPPEQLLEIINQYENQGWKLFGDNSKGSYEVVFTKKVVTPPLIGRNGKIALGLASILTGCAFFLPPL